MTIPTVHRRSYDAIIVGARCAGAATAMLLARQGLRVLAVERSRYGSDTLSTHALMRGGVLQLHRWGVLGRLRAADTPAVRTTRFFYGDEVIELDIKARDGVDELHAPRRTVLDTLLQDEAHASGAEIVHGVRVVDLMRSNGGRVSGVVVEQSDGTATELEAGIVIGADGVRSTVARLVDAEVVHAGVHATGNVYGYWRGLEVEGYHWYYRPGVSAGAIPTNDHATCVFVSMPQRRFREEIRSDIDTGYHRVLTECAPDLTAEVARAERAGRLMAFAGVEGFLRQSWGPGWALVGDAAYFKDPLTAHGISDALRDAELLARAVVRGSDEALADYQTTRDELSLGLFEVTDAIASFDWSIDEVKRLHIDLSREMNREVEAMVRMHDEPEVAGPIATGEGRLAETA
jgi:2-polyprenyl-6-methoxyphenol hydroxylase-like FAD-dependent oxidoreductase